MKREGWIGVFEGERSACEACLGFDHHERGGWSSGDDYPHKSTHNLRSRPFFLPLTTDQHTSLMMKMYGGTEQESSVDRSEMRLVEVTQVRMCLIFTTEE